MVQNITSDASPKAFIGGHDDDSLLQCLLVLAATHGITTTKEAIVAGLPVEGGKISPSLFSRAAKRAGLTSNIVKLPLERLNAALFPVVLIMKDERACVLLKIDLDLGKANVVFPEVGDTQIETSIEEISSNYTGLAIYVRPIFRFDARAPGVKTARHEHWFWGVIAENRVLYMDVLKAAFLTNLLALGLPIFTMNVYDRVVPNNALDTLWVLAFGVFVVLVASAVLRVVRSRFVDLASSRADVKLSAYIMERVLGTRMENKPLSAGSMASNLRAFESVRDFISSATVTAFVDLPFALIFIAVIAWIAPLLVLPVFFGATFMLFFSLATQERMRELSDTTHRASAQRNSTLIEGLVGFETLKSFGAEAGFQRKWENSAAYQSRVSAQSNLINVTSSSVSQFAQNLVGLSLLIFGVYLISNGQMTSGALMACYMLSIRAMAPIGHVVGLLSRFHLASTSLASLEIMMEAEVERPADANYISRSSFRGSIEFRDVSFHYPGQDVQALKNINVSISAGEHVAVLGRIGSGKTTLEKLILGLYRPTGGSVLIDGIDQRQLDPAELRRHIGYVPQDVTLFYGSLRDNIVLGAPLADDAAVVKSAAIAGLSDFVNQHPQGFDMLIGERGESLSGGQKQSVAIARAVIADPPMLLLDEPTASMDQSSENEIKRRITEYAKGRTLLVVTHRTSLLDLVNRVIIMDGGKVVADGPKEQVIKALREGLVGKG
jgi:ATP-binding cassette subfamily C protein LapB